MAVWDTARSERLAEIRRAVGDLAVRAMRAGPQKVRSGEFIADLLMERLRSRWENAASEDVRKRFPGLDDEAVADRLIRQACLRASLAGAMGGAAISAQELATLAGGGIPATVALPLASATLVAEMAYTRLVYLDLVTDLARLYGHHLDPSSPEDALPVVGMVLGLKGRFQGSGAIPLRDLVVRHAGARVLGRRLLPRALPVVSIVMGAGLNTAGAIAIGRAAKARFQGPQHPWPSARQFPAPPEDPR